MKIGVIHATVNAVVPLVNGFKKMYPDVIVQNFVNESLLYNVNQNGMVKNSDRQAFLRTIFQALDAGVDGIIVACSVYCPLVPDIRDFVSVPIIAVDYPMIEKAVSLDGKIGIVATTELSGPTTEKQIKVLNPKADTEVVWVPDAMKALKAGDVSKHDQLVKDACLKLNDMGFKTLVLCQISMASAKEAMLDESFAVLTSIEEGVNAIYQAVCEASNGFH